MSAVRTADGAARAGPAGAALPGAGLTGRVALALPAWLPGLALTLLLTLPAWGPFLHPALDVARLLDGDQHLAKAYSLAQLIAAGEWYPRWTPDLYGGYGYPTFVYYAPATYYLLLAVALLPGAGLATAYQVAGAGAAAAFVVGVYALGWALWRNAPAALLAAATAAYAPYALAVNLFVRGAVPEVAGLALLAWLLWAITRAWTDGAAAGPAADGVAIGDATGDARGGDRRWRWRLLVAALTAALLLTHNITAATGGLLCALWLGCLWLWRPGPGVLPGLAGAALLGALAAAFFWLPALAGTGLVQIERMYRGNLHYRNWFLAWPGVHAALWGLPERSPWTPGFPIDLHPVYRNALYGAPKAGLWQSLLVLLGLGAGAGWWLRRGGRSGAPGGAARLAALSCLFGAGVAVLLYVQSFDWALPLWERAAAVRAIQAPYRLLGPAALATALAAGGALALWRRPDRAAWAGALILGGALAVAGAAGRDVPLSASGDRPGGVAAAVARQRAQPGTTASTDEFLPRTADFETWHEGEARGFWLYERLFPEASWIAGRVQVWRGAAAVHTVSGGGLWTSARVTAGDDGAALAFHQLAFPGWTATVDGRGVPAAVVPELPQQALRPGFLQVDVPPGDHEVTLRFRPRALDLGAAALAAGAVLLLVLLPPGRRARAGRLLLVAGGAVLIAAAGAWVVPRRLARFTSPATAEVVVNLTDAALAGRAELRSPSGPALGPDRFLDVRALTVLPADRPQRDAGPRTRRWLFAHPPAEIAVDLTVPRGALFQTALAVDPAAWEGELGDGVRFLVGVRPEGGNETLLLDATVHPRGRGEQRRWLDVAADLRPWAGQRVRLSLRTDPRDDPSVDWSGWAEPVVVRVDDQTADRLLQSTAQLQERVLRP